jgi:hypothetical protein
MQLSKAIILRTTSCNNPIEKIEFDFQVNFGIGDKLTIEFEKNFFLFWIISFSTGPSFFEMF